MNHLLEVCFVALSLATNPAPSCATQSPAAAPANSSFAGTWEGRMNDLPGIELNIQEAGRTTSGTIVSYLHKGADPSRPWHGEGESAVPLVAPHVAGSTLTLEAQHQRCHGCLEIGPNAKFRMALAGFNEARLWNPDKETDSRPGLRLIQRTEATAGGAQELRAGISVELAVTRNAVPMPDADQKDAMIVSITKDGRLYFGINPITPAALAGSVKGGRSKQGEKKVYIKVDARTCYANVVKVLAAVRTAGVEAPILLTGQQDSPEPSMPVPPKGLEAWVSPAFPHGGEATVVQVLDSGQRPPTLKVNHQQIAWATLPRTLMQLFQSQSERVVLVKAEQTLAYADVVAVIDMSRATGAKVVLITPGLDL